METTSVGDVAAALMIATFRGFVASYKTINNRRKLEYTPDVRQALTFGSYKEAERFIAPHAEHWAAKKSATPYFAIMCSAGILSPVLIPVIQQEIPAVLLQQ